MAICTFIVLPGTNGCVNSCVNSPEDGPVGPKHVEIRRYMNKIETVTSVGFSFQILLSFQESRHSYMFHWRLFQWIYVQFFLRAPGAVRTAVWEPRN